MPTTMSTGTHTRQSSDSQSDMITDTLIQDENISYRLALTNALIDKVFNVKI